MLHEIQSLTVFLSFCAQVVQLGRVFMRKLWDFVASYPKDCSQFLKRRISSDVLVRADLWRWNELLLFYNGVQFFNVDARKIVQLYTDISLHGIGGFYYEDNTQSQSQITSIIEQNHAFAVLITASTHIKHSRNRSNTAGNRDLGQTMVSDGICDI